MSIEVPFESDQAEGLRQLFRSVQTPQTYLGFISLLDKVTTQRTLEALQQKAQADGLDCAIFDEHPHAATTQREEASVILLNAHPSKNTKLKRCSALVMLSNAQSQQLTLSVLKATQGIGKQRFVVCDACPQEHRDQYAALAQVLDGDAAALYKKLRPIMESA